MRINRREQRQKAGRLVSPIYSNSGERWEVLINQGDGNGEEVVGFWRLTEVVDDLDEGYVRQRGIPARY